MTKTADLTQRVLHRTKESETPQVSEFTYCVEVPGFLEGKSLFETHCSLFWCANRQTDMCVSAYLNTPNPNAATMSVQVREKFDEVPDSGCGGEFHSLTLVLLL